MKIIHSRGNPLVQDLHRLAKSSRARRQQGLALIEGERLVAELPGTGVRTKLLVTASSYTGELPLRMSADVQRVQLSDALFSGISDVIHSQGILALIQVPDTEPWQAETRSVLFLESIQDPGNLGTILRTAAAAGIRHVGLSTGSVFAWSPKVLRAGMGAHFRLSIHEDEDVEARLASLSIPAVAADAAAEVSLFRTDLARPVAWVFGNEGAGLSVRLKNLCKERLRIPMQADTESLNVATAVAICLFEQYRQLCT